VVPGNIPHETQLDVDQYGEADKMLLSTEIAGSKTLDVNAFKGTELQGPASQTLKWPTV
jgi:hypothetical protein